MRFKKHVTDEKKEFLTELLKHYKSETPMSAEEKKELHKWVAAGHSPYENGSFCYGAGGLVDFISAYRAEEERQKWFDNLTPEEQYLEQLGCYPWEDDDQEWDFDTMDSSINTYALTGDEKLPFD